MPFLEAHRGPNSIYARMALQDNSLLPLRLRQVPHM